MLDYTLASSAFRMDQRSGVGEDAKMPGVLVSLKLKQQQCAMLWSFDLRACATNDIQHFWLRSTTVVTPVSDSSLQMQV